MRKYLVLALLINLFFLLNIYSQTPNLLDSLDSYLTINENPTGDIYLVPLDLKGKNEFYLEKEIKYSLLEKDMIYRFGRMSAHPDNYFFKYVGEYKLFFYEKEQAYHLYDDAISLFENRNCTEKEILEIVKEKTP
jgi:hypothetical protein